MRLAVFFPASLYSAWCCSYGLVYTLQRMGHEVHSWPLDPNKPSPVAGDFSAFDGVIASGPEHIGSRVPRPKVPTIGWLHETVDREDYGALDVTALKRGADLIFCPAKQDQKYGFRYLPFAADTDIFHPDPEQPRSRDAGFIGLLYDKRKEFLKQLRPLLNGTKFSTGNVQVLEVDGVNPIKTAHLYALNLRSFKVFVNLPTLSQLAVTKIYEALACGTTVLTPTIDHPENLAGLPVSVYRNAEECAELIRRQLQLAPAPNAISADVHKHHSLEQRCHVLVDALKELGAKAA